jgi:hypothetical protein
MVATTQQGASTGYDDRVAYAQSNFIEVAKRDDESSNEDAAQIPGWPGGFSYDGP